VNEEVTVSRHSHEAIAAGLKEIWRRELGIDEIPADDNFFELGGRSGNFVRVAIAVEERFGVELSLRDFFNSPTIRGLTAQVATLAGTSVAGDTA
jgi:acyl carrier protein